MRGGSWMRGWKVEYGGGRQKDVESLVLGDSITWNAEI
jgi:hypothetical protein